MICFFFVIFIEIYRHHRQPFFIHCLIFSPPISMLVSNSIHRYEDILQLCNNNGYIFENDSSSRGTENTKIKSPPPESLYIFEIHYIGAIFILGYTVNKAAVVRGGW